MIADGDRLKRTGIIADGQVVRESLSARNGRMRPVTDPAGTVAAADVTHAGETVIFGGHATPSYGHFLLEGLARLWITRTMPEAPVAWIGMHPFASWHRQLLALLGIDAPQIYVERPLRFANVILPQAGYRIADFFADEHRDFLGRVEPSAIVKGRRAWLSRAHLALHQGRVSDEPDIERTLAAAGWEIYHPQEHPIRDQLAYLSSCEVLSGFEGSAFHTLILLREVRSRLIIFQRGEGLHPSYTKIAEAKSIDQAVHALPVSVIGGEERSGRIWRLDDPAQVSAVLGRDGLI